jgi:hypothetical protein
VKILLCAVLAGVACLSGQEAKPKKLSGDLTGNPAPAQWHDCPKTGCAIDFPAGNYECPVGKEPVLELNLETKVYIGKCIPKPPAAPFDVAPTERRATEADFMHYDSPQTIVIRSCADKSRFLLMDESRKWHCLALTERP